MGSNRIEAFSDGMMAIFITIMVLEFKVPEGTSARDLLPLLPNVLSYVLSFIYVGIYWNNHHHMLHAAKKVSGAIMWANLHLLFWLSLIPFVTGWMGENNFASVPTALYGVVLFLSAIAYWILQSIIVREHRGDTILAQTSKLKIRISPVLYVAAIVCAFYVEWLAGALYAFVALMWLVPDRRIERALGEH